MADNTLRIGVEMDVSQLLSGASKAQTSFRDMESVFSSAMQQAATIVDSSIGSINSSFSGVNEALDSAAAAAASFAPQVQAQASSVLNLKAALAEANSELKETEGMIMSAGGAANVASSLITRYSQEQVAARIIQQQLNQATDQYKLTLNAAAEAQTQLAAVRAEAEAADAATLAFEESLTTRIAQETQATEEATVAFREMLEARLAAAGAPGVIAGAAAVAPAEEPEGGAEAGGTNETALAAVETLNAAREAQIAAVESETVAQEAASSADERVIASRQQLAEANQRVNASSVEYEAQLMSDVSADEAIDAAEEQLDAALSQQAAAQTEVTAATHAQSLAQQQLAAATAARIAADGQVAAAEGAVSTATDEGAAAQTKLAAAQSTQAESARATTTASTQATAATTVATTATITREQAVRNLQMAEQELAAIEKSLGVNDASAAAAIQLRNLPLVREATEAVTRAKAQLAQVEAQLTATTDTETTALDANAAASEKAGAGMLSLSERLGVARAGTAAMTDNVGMAEYGLARIAASSRTLAPLLEAVFAPVLAVAFVEIITNLAERFYKVYENVVLLKSSIDALDKVGESEADKAASLNYQYEESLARRLEAQGKLTEASAMYAKAAGDKPLDFPKIDDKVFKQFNKDFVTFLQSVHASADAPSVITRINAEAEATQKQLDELKKKHDDLVATQKADQEKLRSQGYTDIFAPSAGGASGSTFLKNYDKEVEDLTKKLEVLRTMVGEIQSQTGADANAAATKAAENQAKAARERIEAERKENDFNVSELERSMAAWERNNEEMIRLQQEKDEWTVKESAKIDDEIVKNQTEAIVKMDKARTDQANNDIHIAESAALSEIAIEQSKAELQAKIRQGQIAVTTTVPLNPFAKIGMTEAADAAEIDELKKFEDQKLAIQVKALEDQQAVLRGGQTPEQFAAAPPSPEILAEWQKLQNQIIAIREKSNERQHELDNQLVANSAKAAQEIEKEFDKVFQQLASTIESSVGRSFDGVIRGTETVRQAFNQMGAQIVMDLIHWGEKEVITFALNEAKKLAMHIAGQHMQTAATASGIASRESLEKGAFVQHLARDAAEVLGHVAKEAAKTAATIAAVAARAAVEIAAHFATALMRAKEAAQGAYAATTPIPIVGPILAPIAAAAAFAAVLAFKEGGVVPETGLAMVHEHEMVLPAHISTAIQGAVPAMQSFASRSAEPAAFLSAYNGPMVNNTVNNTNNSRPRGPLRIENHFHGTDKGLGHDDIVAAVNEGLRRGDIRMKL